MALSENYPSPYCQVHYTGHILILSPKCWALGAPGILGPIFSSSSIRHMQLQMTEGAQPGSHCGHCHLQKGGVTWEPRKGLMSQELELTVLRQPRPSWATKANLFSPYEVQRTTLATHGLGEGNCLLGKSLSCPCLCDAEHRSSLWLENYKVEQHHPDLSSQCFHLTDEGHVTPWLEMDLFSWQVYEVNSIQTACALVLALLLTSCVIMYKLLHSSVPRFPLP